MGLKCIYFCMSVFSTWAENGSTVTQGRGAGEAAAITGSEFGLGQVLDSNWGQHGFVFLPCLGGQAARRSAGFRSEQGQEYYGMKDAKKLLDKPTNGAGPVVGEENVCACLLLRAQLQF